MLVFALLAVSSRFAGAQQPPSALPPLPPPPPATAPPSAVPLPPGSTPDVAPPLPPPPPAQATQPNYYYPPYVPPRTERRWYGAQTLIADGASLALLVAGRDSSKTIELGVAGLLLAPPIIHWAHGNVGKGFGSLALRILPPIVAVALIVDGGGFESSSRKSDIEVDLGVIVALAWIPTAIAVDAAVLAYDDVPVKSAVTWRPGFSLVRGGATVGAGGTF
jgi:hypothetical protein